MVKAGKRIDELSKILLLDSKTSRYRQLISVIHRLALLLQKIERSPVLALNYLVYKETSYSRKWTALFTLDMGPTERVAFFDWWEVNSSKLEEDISRCLKYLDLLNIVSLKEGTISDLKT